MENTYSLLRDEEVLKEIRKHKWIESEKAGREIGFATAAYDWICRFGNDWLEHQIDLSRERMTALQHALALRERRSRAAAPSGRR